MLPGVSQASAALLCPRPHSGDIKRWCASDVCLSVWRPSVAHIGPKSRTVRPRKTKIGKEVGHVTRDSDTTFKVKKSKVNLQGAGHILAASRTACCIHSVYLPSSRHYITYHSLLLHTLYCSGRTAKFLVVSGNNHSIVMRISLLGTTRCSGPRVYKTSYFVQSEGRKKHKC